MYWVPKCEFYFAIIGVVAEQIRVDQPKNQFKFRLASSDVLHVCCCVRVSIAITLFRI